MPLSRYAKMSPQKREHLMTVAAKEFATYGFEAASLNRILAEARIAKSSVYYYFEDKADLYCTVIQHCVQRLDLAPNPNELDALSADTFWELFAAIHHRPLLQFKHEPWLFGALRSLERLSVDSLHHHEQIADLVLMITEYMRNGVGAMIKRGQEFGLIRSDLPDELIFAWFKGIDGATDEWLLQHVDELDDQTYLHILDETIGTIKKAIQP